MEIWSACPAFHQRRYPQRPLGPCCLWLVKSVVCQCWIWTLLSSHWVAQLFILKLVPGFCYWVPFVRHPWWNHSIPFHPCWLPFELLFCIVLPTTVVCRRKQNHRVEHRPRPFKPVVGAALETNEFAVLSRLAFIWTNSVGVTNSTFAWTKTPVRTFWEGFGIKVR